MKNSDLARFEQGRARTISRQRSRSLAMLSVGGVAVLGIGAALATLPPQPHDGAEPKMSAAAAPAISAELPSQVQHSLTPAQRIEAAFFAATGQRSRMVRLVDGEAITTTPIRIVELPFGPALLTRSESNGGCPACTGAIGIYYLRQNGNEIKVVGSWPRAVEGWGLGAAPTEWSVTTRFTAMPAIYAEGGYTSQGVTMSSATITELRPGGPITSEIIGTGFTDAGAKVNGEQVCDVEGKITTIQRDKAFDVAVSGSVTATDRYVKREGKFVATDRIDWEAPCSIRSSPSESEADGAAQ